MNNVIRKLVSEKVGWKVRSVFYIGCDEGGCEIYGVNGNNGKLRAVALVPFGGVGIQIIQ